MRGGGDGGGKGGAGWTGIGGGRGGGGKGQEDGDRDVEGEAQGKGGRRRGMGRERRAGTEGLSEGKEGMGIPSPLSRLSLPGRPSFDPSTRLLTDTFIALSPGRPSGRRP